MNYEQKYLKYKAKYVTLKNQLGGIKGVRAEYEYEVYKYCNQKLKELIKNNQEAYKYILDMCHENVYYFINELISNRVIYEFKYLYNTKTKTVLSGAIDFDSLLEKIIISKTDYKKETETEKKETDIKSKKDIVDINHHINEKTDKKFDDKSTYGNIVDPHIMKNIIKSNFNIRSSLTFLDMVVKFIIGKSKTFKHISEFFDDDIRFRESRNNVDNNWARDELCLDKLKTPSENEKIVNPKHNCLPMIDLIEPYNELEKKKYSDDQLKNFNTGRNVFTSPEIHDTVDVFSAGLSGHTIDISLLFTTFIFKEIKQDDIFLLIFACLIWMLPYYHHSLREIVSIAFIFLDGLDPNYNEDYEKVKELFKIKEKYDFKYNKISFDNVFNMIDTKIAGVKITKKIYKLNHPKTINYPSLFNALLSGNNDKLIKERLKEIDTKGKLINFLSILNNLKKNKKVYVDLPV
jgi:hypothetical protein